MPIFSQFGKIVWQQLFNMVQILQTSLLMLMEIFHDSFENFKITRIFVWKTMQVWLLDGKSFFLKQMLPTFGSRCKRYFWDIGLKILSLPNFNMLFELVLANFSKVNCFHVYRKLITWSSHAKSLLKLNGYFYVFLFQIRSIERMHP